MMYGYGGGMTGWGFAFMTLGNIIFWGLLITGIVLLIRYLSRTTSASSAGAVAPRPGAEEVLRERYARGEIDADEFRARMATLNDAPPRS